MTTRKDTPGRGLGQVLESPHSDDEPTATACKHCGASLVPCPKCKSSGFQALEPVGPVTSSRDYGTYRHVLCTYCKDGCGFVPLAKAELWHLQQPSDSPPARK